jgi:hypothetical protein
MRREKRIQREEVREGKEENEARERKTKRGSLRGGGRK